MKLELGNLQSVRDFVDNLKAFKAIRPLDNLICNAAVYRPTDPEPAWTDDGFEMSMVRSFSKEEIGLCDLWMERITDTFSYKNVFQSGSESSWTFPFG